jgi:hypothetical protein
MTAKKCGMLYLYDVQYVLLNNAIIDKNKGGGYNGASSLP